MQYWEVFSVLLLFSCSVVSNSLRPHGLQHSRLPCPSLSPGACSNSCPLSQWCHPIISSFVAPFFSCPKSFPASGSFPMGRLFTSGDQSIGASASASALPMNIQGWFHLGLIDLVSLLPKRLSRVFSSTAVQKHQFFNAQPSLWSNSHPYMTTGKTIALTRRTFIGKVMSLLLNAQSRFVTAFLLKSKCSFFVLFCFNFMAAVTIHSDFGAHENKIYVCFHFSPLLSAVKWWGWRPWSNRNISEHPLTLVCCFNTTALALAGCKEHSDPLPPDLGNVTMDAVNFVYTKLSS